jgi:hypothetical protein
MTAKPKDEFDARSGKTVLYYVGPGVVGDVPADDLSAHRLARIAWVRSGAPQPRPEPNQSAIAKLRDELIATGNYQEKPPSE